MNRREMFIRSGLGLVALSTLPALASIKAIREILIISIMTKMLAKTLMTL